MFILLSPDEALLLSRLCCRTSGQSLLLPGFSFIMMGEWWWRRRTFPTVKLCDRKGRLSVNPPQYSNAHRKDGGKVFMKRPDPHEEALMILKGQMTHLAAAPGTQVRGRVGLVPGGTEDKEGPQGSSETSYPYKLWLCHCPSTGPACCPLSSLFGVGQVSREAVALVKPVTSVPRPSMAPTSGERARREGGEGVQVYEEVCGHR